MNMHIIQLFRIVMLFYLIGVVFGVAGCSQPVPPQMKPEVVRKKITEKPEAVKPIPIPIQTQIPTPVTTAAVSQPQPAPASMKLPSAPAGGTDADQQKTPDTEAPKPVAGETLPISIAYNPTGKIDPFVPLLKDDPVKPVQPEKVKREKREPMTPLERVDLSQLKLTAIIRTPSGLKAMVEEATGKGYIVGVGTYMGIHSGKVVNILKDRVVVEEEVEDALGNVANRNSELKFQKPSGD